jgi:hypothetical protein
VAAAEVADAASVALPPPSSLTPPPPAAALPATLDLSQFSAWVATFGLGSDEAKLAFRLLDFDHDNTVDSSEIKRAAQLARRMCRSTLTRWVSDALNHAQQVPTASKRQKTGGDQILSRMAAVKAVESKAPKIVADAFRAAAVGGHESHQQRQQQQHQQHQLLQHMDSSTWLSLPAWASEAIHHVANILDVALHFMFNPVLNSSWLNEDHDQLLKDIEQDIVIIPEQQKQHEQQQDRGHPQQWQEGPSSGAAQPSSSAYSSQRLALSPSSSLSSSPGHAVRVRDRLIKRELLIEMSARINAYGLRKRDIVMASLDTVCALTNAERCTVFLLSEDGTEVVSFVLGGVKGDGSNGLSAMAGDEEYTYIRVALGKGIAGTVALTGESLIINDPSRDARWDSNSDQLTGFHTRNMICVPVTTWKVSEMSNSSEVLREEYIIGCVQVLNSKSEDGGFTETDLGWLEEWKTVIGVELAAAHDHRDVMSVR